MQTLLFNYDFMISITSYAAIAGSICAIIGSYKRNDTIFNIGTALFLFMILYVVVYVIANIVTSPL